MKSNIKSTLKKYVKDYIWYYFFCVIITISCVWNIDKAIMPYCVPDEIGYWTAAAWMNDFDWSPLMSHSPYYGWGYGILLSLIFKISNPVLRFRMAIVINALLLVFLFIILSKICNLLFVDIDKKVNIFIAGMATCYSYNLIFAHTSMCEVFLTFLFVLSVYAFMKAMKTHKLIYFIIFGFLILLQFATHLRMLVCIIATILISVYIFWTQKENRKSSLLLALFCFGAVLLVYWVKDSLVKSEYTSVYVSERLTVNEGVISHLSVFRSMMSSEFWYKLINSLVGKIFYLLCSTLFMIVGAFAYALNSIKQNLIDLCSRIEASKDIYLPVKIYVCVCFLGALAVDAISNMYSSRIDGLLYGRYVENMLPIMICMGCYWFIKKCNYKKMFLIILFSFSFLGKVTLIYLNKTKIVTSIPLNVGWFSGWITQEKLNDYFYYTVYPMVVSCILAIAFIILSRMNAKLGCLIMSVIWIISAENGWLNVVTPQLDRMNEVINASYELKQLDEPYLCVIPESFLTDTEELVDVSWLQYQMGTSTLYEINLEELENRKNNIHIIVSKKDKNYDLYTNGGSIMWSNSRFSIVEFQAK